MVLDFDEAQVATLYEFKRLAFNMLKDGEWTNSEFVRQMKSTAWEMTGTVIGENLILLEAKCMTIGSPYATKMRMPWVLHVPKSYTTGCQRIKSQR
jgi:hypothetical protein